MHVDAPWGGGKTTFANFVSAILSAAPAEHIALAKSLKAPFAAVAWPSVDPAASSPQDGNRVRKEPSCAGCGK